MDEEIETHRGQIIYTLGKWDYNTSSVTPYSQPLHHTVTLYWPGSTEEHFYAQWQGATNTIAKKAKGWVVGWAPSLITCFHAPASQSPRFKFSPQQKSKLLHIIDLHGLSQIVRTVTVESMNASVLLYLPFWVNLFLPHSCISLSGFHLLII